MITLTAEPSVGPETIKQYFKIFTIYLLLTFFIFIILNFFDFRSFISFNLSMTLISSGGFLPINNLSTILNSQTKEIIFSILMLSSFFSIFLSYNLLFLKKKILIFFKRIFIWHFIYFYY